MLVAGLVAVFGLGMLNLAGFLALQGRIEPVWAAVVVGSADILLASALALFASRSQTGREIGVALEVRKLALEQIEVDARDLKIAFEALGQEVRNVRASLSQLLHNPLDLAAEKLVIPAALSLLWPAAGLKSQTSLRGLIHDGQNGAVPF